MTRLLVTVVLLAACTSTLGTAPSAIPVTTPAGRTDQAGNVLGPVTEDATWRQLEARPLRIPSLSPGATCPQSSSATLRGSAVAAALGGGPVYAVTGGGWISLGPTATDGVRAGKVMWLARPDYKGPALIRGTRLDGPGDVRFAAGMSTLRFDLDTRTQVGDATDGSVQGWRYLPSQVILPAAGCYGFQIELLDQTISITVLARDQLSR